MKKIIYSTAILLFGVISLESFHTLKLMKKDGAAPGYTGSPGDSLKNCTACHGGFAQNVTGWISSNIPATGYVPNQTYTITTTNRESGATRFGFEISPQALNGMLLGKMIRTDTLRTKFVGDEKYITYSANGIEGVDSLSWTFDWVAPAAGSGEVVFYGAYNSNFDGHKGGDQTFLSTLKVKEAVNSVGQVTKSSGTINTYPNPANNVLNINFDAKTPGTILFDIIDINGNKVIEASHKKHIGVFTKQINTSNLASGNYLVRISNNGSSITKKISIAH